MKRKFLWYSDTHFNFTLPWTRHNFVNKIKEESPAGLILSGDIACGLTIENTLRFFAKKIENFPIYFVLGNHDYYGTSFKATIDAVKRLTKEYPWLHWLTDHDIIEISEDVAIIGDDGWYDARLGNPIYIAYNFDWIMVSEFRQLKTFEDKFMYGQRLADESTKRIKAKLLKALEKYKTVYILTHMPPWAEASRGVGSEIGEFWLPYNINSGLGKMIEEVMLEHDNKNVNVLAGHTHVPAIVHVQHNIECLVQGGKYLGTPTEHNCVFI
jgi:3',5'-cyclic-AMP phosphodiesterase